MGRGRTLGARGLALGLVLIAVAMAPAAAARDDRLESEQRRLRETERKLQEERKQAASARRRETSLLAQLEGIEQTLGTKRREVARLDRQIRRVQAEVAGIRGDIGRLETDRGGQERALARRLRVMYRIHQQGTALPLILSGDDPVARAAAIRHLGSLAVLDARLIREYRVTTERLADRKSREESRQAELASLRAEVAREQAEVDAEAARRRTLLSKVKDERVYHDRMVGELSAAARRLEAFIRDLQERQRRTARTPAPSPAPGTGFGSLRGRLPWPADGQVVAAFGPQVHPRFGTRTFRSGVDIAASAGTAVHAVHAGQVVYTGWFKGYGNLIIVDHGNEYYTLYAHMAEIEVREGEDVRPGQRLGTVGDSGSLEGPRLYFEVRYQGRPQDPEQWLRHRG